MAFRSAKTPKTRDVERVAQDPGTSEGEVTPGARRSVKHDPMLGPRRSRLRVESLLMRLVATGGILGLGVLLGALLVSQDVAGWIVGLCVSGMSLVLAALLWSSNEL